MLVVFTYKSKKSKVVCVPRTPLPVTAIPFWGGTGGRVPEWNIVHWTRSPAPGANGRDDKTETYWGYWTPQETTNPLLKTEQLT